MAGPPPSPPAPVPVVPATESPLHQYIPPELLLKLEEARATGGMEGERRIVTMLFCDVKGSTAAAGQLDPEEWADLMNGAFDCLIRPVYRYEGTIARLMGDAILAFFGAPIAHEDDPQRAIMAGLDIVKEIGPYRRKVKREWGIDFDVRVGINTGLVVVGAVGSDLRVEYTAMGDAVNLAARMEQTAEPGTVQISQETHKRVGPLFHFESLGGIQVKGKVEPVEAWRVVGPREAPGELRGIEGLSAPLIGRADEFASLLGAFQRISQGSGCIASVIGEAGLGKSRLMRELRQRVADDGMLDGVTWLEGRSLSYETTTPYAPFIAMFERLFGLDPEHSAAERYRRIEAYLAPIMPERVVATAPVLATMLGVELTGEPAQRVKYVAAPQLRGMVFAAILETCEALCRARPLVVSFEDLHWADETSLQLLEPLQQLSERCMVMVVALFRPRRQDGSWRFHELASRHHAHRYTPVELAPLDKAQTYELVERLLTINDLPEQVRELILDKAQGNPFFVEEVVRTLLEEGLVVKEGPHWRATAEIREVRVPDNLRSLLTARLDRLDEQPKRTIQIAAVLGREFDHSTLAHLHSHPMSLETSLGELQRKELISDQGRIPTRRFAFHHVLVQEAAYETLLLRRRRELHAAAADLFERTETGRPEEIARHFLAARQPVQALPYLIEAGESASRAYAASDAIGYFEQALAILVDSPDPTLGRRALEGMGGAQQWSFDLEGALATFQKMQAQAEATSDTCTVVSALNKQGFIRALFQGDYVVGSELLDRSEALAREHGDHPGLIEGAMTRCAIGTSQGHLEKVEAYMGDMEANAKAIKAHDATLFGMTHFTNTLVFLGRFEEALAKAEEVLAFADKVGDRAHPADLLAYAMPLCHLRSGALDGAESLARRGVEMGEQIGSLSSIAMGNCMLSQIAGLRGDLEDAVRFNERGLEAAEAAGMPYLTTVSLCTLGTAWLNVGKTYLETASGFHERAMEAMAQPTGAASASWLLCEVGHCALASDDVETADELFTRGLEVPNAATHLLKPSLLLGKSRVALARKEPASAAGFVDAASKLVDEREMLDHQPFVAVARAGVHEALSDPEAALECYGIAEQGARELGFLPLLMRTLASTARLLEVTGRSSEAARRSRDAQAIAGQLAGRIRDPGMRSAFEKDAHETIP